MTSRSNLTWTQGITNDSIFPFEGNICISRSDNDPCNQVMYALAGWERVVPTSYTSSYVIHERSQKPRSIIYCYNFLPQAWIVLYVSIVLKLVWSCVDFVMNDNNTVDNSRHPLNWHENLELVLGIIAGYDWIDVKYRLKNVKTASTLSFSSWTLKMRLKWEQSKKNQWQNMKHLHIKP